MSIMHRAYKFRIYPNSSQKVLLAKTFGCVRLVFNHYLALRSETYEKTGRSPSYTKCAADLVSFKKENTFLQEVDSIALQQALRHLDTAFQNFFRDKKVGYPRFKSKKNHSDSYCTVCVNNNIKLEAGYLTVPKIGRIRIRQHRRLPDDACIKSVTLKKTPSGKYFASVSFEYEANIVSVHPQRVIGLDFSMPDLFVSSEGDVQADEVFLHHYRKALDKLAKEQRILSHRKPGSARYIKQRIKVAKLHEKVANQRKDYLHKLSRQITNAFDVVCIEDLDMQGMSQALNFGKAVSDNGWGMFTRFLDYKLSDEGKALVRIDKWFPSSKTCHVCGHVLDELSLDVRKWECPDCKTVHDRDRNAAINIRQEGLRVLNA